METGLICHTAHIKFAPQECSFPTLLFTPLTLDYIDYDVSNLMC